MVKRKIVILVGLLVIFLVLALEFTFFYKKKCENFSCFQDSMKQCKQVIYINDEVEATWRYEIIGLRGNECVINVELLQLKQGDISFEKLSGYGMECSYLKGIAVYPEKDLNKCHGRLKEELQTAIISRLHAYIVYNLGGIDKGLENFIG